jgi:hypothetical protein
MKVSFIKVEYSLSDIPGTSSVSDLGFYFFFLAGVGWGFEIFA